jgi:hypothetical protein
MANKYMRQCLPSLSIKKTEITTTLTFHLTLVKMAYHQENKQQKNAGKDPRNKEHFHTFHGNVN